MTDREKLVELLTDCDCPYPCKSADYLIENGVAPVVHGRWDPVKYNAHGKATTTPTAGSNYQSCKHCKTAVIGMEEYAECPECGKPFEEVAHA